MGAAVAPVGRRPPVVLEDGACWEGPAGGEAGSCTRVFDGFVVFRLVQVTAFTILSFALQSIYTASIPQHIRPVITHTTLHVHTTGS